MAGRRLDADRERALLLQYQASLVRGEPDHEARNQLIEGHLPLIMWAANAIHQSNRRHVERGDLVSVGTLGMIEALNRFDVSRPTRISTYALWWISNAMHAYVRNVRWQMHVSEKNYKRILKMQRQIAQMPPRFDDSFDFMQLAERLGWTEAECIEVYTLAKTWISLETPVSKDGRLRLGDTIDDRWLMGPHDVIALLQFKEAVRAACEELPRNEREAIEFFFFDRYVEFDAGVSKRKHDSLRYRRAKALARLRRSAAIQHARKFFASAAAKSTT